MLRNAKVYAHARGGTGCGMLRNASAQTHKGNRLPAGANHLAPECNRLEPRANRQRPGAERLTAAPRMLRIVKVSRYEQRANREKKHIEARAKQENFINEARAKPEKAGLTSRELRELNAENVTGHMMKYDEIPKEAKRAARLFHKIVINLPAADPAPKSSKVVKRDLSRSQAHRATHRARDITIMPIKENAASERHSSTRAQP